MFLPVLLVACRDTSLGRCDRGSLHQQTLLELFVSSIEDKSRFQDTNEVYLPIKKWTGIVYDSEGNITRIVWSWALLRGSIDLRWAPETLEYLSLGNNDLSGGVSLNELPHTLSFLSLSVNHLTGSLGLTCLPARLKTLYMSHNLFSGSVDLAHLPASLQSLDISHNALSGRVDLSKLPQAMFNLDLRNNSLSGETRVPRTLEQVVFLALNPGLVMKFV